MSTAINSRSNALVESINDSQEMTQQPMTIEQDSQSVKVRNNNQEIIKQVPSQGQQSEKTAISSNDAQKNDPQKVKRTRHRLSQKEQYELAVNATKFLKAGFSLKATAVTLSTPEERLFSILLKNKFLNHVDFNTFTVFLVDELIQFFQEKFDSPLVDIREEGEGFHVTKHKANFEGESNE